VITTSAGARRLLLGLTLGLGLGGPVALGLGGCGKRVERKDGRYPVRIVRVTDRSAGDEDVSRDMVKQVVGTALAAEDSFELVSDGEALRAEIWFAEQPGPTGQRDLIVGLRVETPPDLSTRLGEEGLEANVLLERESGQASLAEDLNLAIGRAVGVLEARVGLARGDAERVNELLGADDPELVLLALEWVRDRRSPADPDRVAALLGHSDERVGLLAIEALGVIGGPEHVQRLLRGVRLSDPGQAHRAYEALTALGGPDARAFLEFAARNEDEPERRQAAMRALAELDRGSADGNVVESVQDPGPSRGHRQ
jgi:hypothetical protein